MTGKEIIEKIKDRLLKNSWKEYQNNLERCGDYSGKGKSKYDKLDQELFEERTYLMQDYDDITNHSEWREEDLNYNYNE